MFAQDHRPLCSARRQGLVALPVVARVRASKFQSAAVSRLDGKASEYCVHRLRGQLLAPIFHRAWPTSRYSRATSREVSSTFLTATVPIVRAVVCAQSMMRATGPLSMATQISRKVSALPMGKASCRQMILTSRCTR